ncbi:hypothetical protein AWC11_12065 [Mycobacterium interjectum]|nr:hypothetical protein AWC11_12065 [Mycobacterium interjectum]
MGYHDDPARYEQRLKAKLQPDSIRATLAFAGLYQMTHEMLKQTVLDKVREFYCFETNLDDAMTGEEQEQYQRHVLSLAPNRFEASLIWLVQSKAITQVQADRLDAIYDHRHSLAHELVKYIVDPDTDPDVALLVEAIETLKDLHRFWIDIEISSGGFFFPDGADVGEFDAEDVEPLSLMVLQQCLDAYLGGLPTPDS